MQEFITTLDSAIALFYKAIVVCFGLIVTVVLLLLIIRSASAASDWVDRHMDSEFIALGAALFVIFAWIAIIMAAGAGMVINFGGAM